MQDDREMAETAIELDFFGPAGLRDEEEPPAPPKYVIERRLGRGGSGAVYLAEDTTLGRPVALKYLSHARAADVERFLREARFAARLRNPSIVQVYEAGEVEGVPYIAMQYIPGANLATASLDRPGILQVVRQVAEALAHAHDEGVVHRDVKPENILVDSDGRGYVTDFGIARDLRARVGITISQDGHIIGTPGLMAPEQARGEVRAIDARTDVYALGATLYAKLTGRLPFTGDSVVELLHAVIHDEPPFPRALRADIPRDLEALLLKCLRKRREDRYQSMREVLAALDRAGEARQVSTPWFTTYVRKRVDSAPPAADEPPSEQDWAAAIDAAREIADWDMHLYRVRSDLQRHYPRLDALIARLTAVVDERPSTGWARFYRGVAWFRRGELRKALDDMERTVDRVGLAGAYYELGRLYLAICLDQHRQAHEHLTHTGSTDHLQSVRSRLDQASLAFSEAQRLKADVPEWQLQYASAVRRLATQDFDGCIAACDAILASDPDLDDVWKLKGDALRRARRDPVPAYERCVEIRRSAYEALLAMADVLIERGALDEARRCLAQALEVHGGLVWARVLQARANLKEARATGRQEPLDAALADAAAAVEADPKRYDATVTLAEAQIELARRTDDAACVDTALALLEVAATLDGCVNRVNYTEAQARLVRARLALASGGDPRADLEAVARWRAHHAAHDHHDDQRLWMTTIEEAERLLGEIRRAEL